jgi:2-polyprenyl-3-methyl-5-hydroxy-6-metoxy-1,4-benzoquinol methylase
MWTEKDRSRGMMCSDTEQTARGSSEGKPRYRTTPATEHAEGFPIFLSPQEVAALDEYRDSDPYSVEEGLATPFHQRRVVSTLALVGKALQSLGRPSRILDLGCGRGHITREIQKAYPETHISGLDCSVSAIEYADRHSNRICYAVADARTPPYCDGYFDVVVCNNLWEHVPDPAAMLAEIVRITATGGFLVVSTPSRYRLRNLARVLTGRPVAFMSDKHITEYSVGQVLEQLRYGGFDVVEVTSSPIGTSGLKLRLAWLVFSAGVALFRSHHRLESTVFYLARRV